MRPSQERSKSVKPEEAVQATYLEVKPRKNESTERMIKRFSKMVRDDGILKEFASRTYFEKPSTIRRRKRMKAKWNAKNDIKK